MKIEKLIRAADKLHFQYSREELKLELEKRKLGVKSNSDLSRISTQVIKKAIDIYSEEDNVAVEVLCVFSDLEYLKRLLEIRKDPKAFEQFAKQDVVDSKFDVETIEKAIQHYYDEQFIHKRKEYDVQSDV